MAYLAKLTLAKFPFDKLLTASSLALGLSLGPSALAGSAAPGTPAPPPQKGVNIGSGPKAPSSKSDRYPINTVIGPRRSCATRLRNWLFAPAASAKASARSRSS